MKNVGASVSAKLKNLARATGADMQTLLSRYVHERFLYRLARSRHAPGYALKGGLLMSVYAGGDLLRPSVDLDLDGEAADRRDVDEIAAMAREVVATAVPDDGVSFELASLKVVKERNEGIVPGGKIAIDARVHTSRVPLRIDVGFGNAITPECAAVEIPTILPDVAPRPTIRVYPLETTIAEKLHAMVQHGADNTRHKDYYDLWRISLLQPFDGALLATAVANTFATQGRLLPADPDALASSFGGRNGGPWAAFLRRSGLQAPSYPEVIERLRSFLLPVISTARGDAPSPGEWKPDAGWSDRGHGGPHPP